MLYDICNFILYWIRFRIVSKGYFWYIHVFRCFLMFSWLFFVPSSFSFCFCINLHIIHRYSLSLFPDFSLGKLRVRLQNISLIQSCVLFYFFQMYKSKLEGKKLSLLYWILEFCLWIGEMFFVDYLKHWCLFFNTFFYCYLLCRKNL